MMHKALPADGAKTPAGFRGFYYAVPKEEYSMDTASFLGATHLEVPRLLTYLALVELGPKSLGPKRSPAPHLGHEGIMHDNSVFYPSVIYVCCIWQPCSGNDA